MRLDRWEPSNASGLGWARFIVSQVAGSGQLTGVAVRPALATPYEDTPVDSSWHIVDNQSLSVDHKATDGWLPLSHTFGAAWEINILPWRASLHGFDVQLMDDTGQRTLTARYVWGSDSWSRTKNHYVVACDQRMGQVTLLKGCLLSQSNQALF
jgi:hypothetical protein